MPEGLGVGWGRWEQKMGSPGRVTATTSAPAGEGASDVLRRCRYTVYGIFPNRSVSVCELPGSTLMKHHGLSGSGSRNSFSRGSEAGGMKPRRRQGRPPSKGSGSNSLWPLPASGGCRPALVVPGLQSHSSSLCFRCHGGFSSVSEFPSSYGTPVTG